VDELRTWMARHDLDTAYVTRPVSIAYLTGVHADPVERLMALVLRPHRMTLVVPGGVRIEDDVVVQAGGVRLLTSADRSLHVVDP
jgi:Xaa-Pro aminopeptidase